MFIMKFRDPIAPRYSFIGPSDLVDLLALGGFHHHELGGKGSKKLLLTPPCGVRDKNISWGRELVRRREECLQGERKRQLYPGRKKLRPNGKRPLSISVTLSTKPFHPLSSLWNAHQKTFLGWQKGVFGFYGFVLSTRTPNCCCFWLLGVCRCWIV